MFLIILEETLLRNAAPRRTFYFTGHTFKQKTQAEKACVLAEELGHHYTSTGNIIELHDTANRKQEFRARLWAYNRQIGLHGLISAYKAGCQSLYEIAEYLNVTEDFLLEAAESYRNKYGIGTMIDHYWITFIPTLQVYEYREI